MAHITAKPVKTETLTLSEVLTLIKGTGLRRPPQPGRTEAISLPRCNPKRIADMAEITCLGHDEFQVVWTNLGLK